MMRTNTKRLPGLREWPLALCASALLAACGGSGTSASGGATTAAIKLAGTAGSSVPQIYAVVNLPPNFTPASTARNLNDSGQVCGSLTDPATGQSHAALFDGSVLKDLTPGDPGFSVAREVNAYGWVVGYSGSFLQGKGFYYDGTTRIDIGTLDGVGAIPSLINDRGQLAGTRRNVDGTTDVFLYDHGAKAIVDRPANASLQSATGMNAQGQIVGVRVPGSGDTRSFLYSGGQTVDIGGFDATSFTNATAINDMGQVTGAYWNGRANHAFRYQGGTMTDLGALDSASDYSFGSRINANGWVAGYSLVAGVLHAFVHDGAAMRDLGTLGGGSTFATAINAAGMTVGRSSLPGISKTHAFAWFPTDGTMIDLNERIDRALNIELYTATTISDSGIILAQANTGWVLLKPIPASIAPPTLGPIVANDPVPVGSPVNANVQFTDADAADTHTATWNWDGSGATPASLAEPNGTTPGSSNSSHVFTAAGVYNVTVTVTDSGGRSTSVGSQVVVYDPNGGFVAGGGWINSPVGAYKADPTMGGRATFGFTSKYLKGATKPSGQTEFQFQSADLNFHSSNYDWLVVGGARAQYKGTGTINGSGSYKFMLTAVDGDLIGKGTPDRFRMRIWHYDEASKTDVVDYDNQIDSGTEGSNLEGTAIGGGSISIKTK